MEDISICMAHVSKQYRLGLIGGKTLQEDLQSWWARRMRREDPNSIIGSTRKVGQSFWALQDINLTVRRGERVGIIGANGAGKSTLLKLLSRVTAPTAGDIDLWGRVSSMLEVGTGFHREMTGRENIYMNGSILGMTRREIDERMEAIIDFSEIREFIDTPVKRYSSGMFVKLAFSVAAHLQSEIMIMDEVLAVGDMAFQRKCLDRMRRAAEQENRTVLYVSHNMDTIRRLCDRCVVLDKGRVIFDGDTEQAVAMYLNQSLGENQVDMDLTAATRPKQCRDTGLVMTRLLLPDRLAPVYERGEDLQMQLALSSEKPFEDIAVRLTFRTEADVGLGTGWSKAFSLEGRGKHVISLRMPLDDLMKGAFYGSIGVYRFDEIGRPVMLDHITRAFKIELAGTPVWSVSAHGYLHLPDLELTGRVHQD
ncbi:MAG: ABC transporter ATP-binding protein [Lachnospiraceae bacterium]|nr:ABC transporter ATP-binding protein [Lachnospiraceae bacterium]